MSPVEYRPDPWQVHKPARRAQVAVEFADGSWTLTTLVGAALRPEVEVGLEQGTGRRFGLTFAGVDDYRVHQGPDLSGLPRAEGDAAAWSERYLEGAPEPPEVVPARHPDGPDPARVEHVRMWLDPADGWPDGSGWPVVVSAGTEGFEGLARLWIGSTGQRSEVPFRVVRAGWDGVTRYLDLHLAPEGGPGDPAEPDGWAEVSPGPPVSPWPSGLALRVRFLLPGQPEAIEAAADQWVPRLNAGSVVIAGIEWRPAVTRWQASTRTLEVVLEQPEDPTPDPEPVEESRGGESLRMALQQALADHATAASTGPVFGTMAVGFRPQTLSVPEVRYLLTLLPPPPLPTEPGSRILITEGPGVPLEQGRVAFRLQDRASGPRWVDSLGKRWKDTDITGWRPWSDDD